MCAVIRVSNPQRIATNVMVPGRPLPRHQCFKPSKDRYKPFFINTVELELFIVSNPQRIATNLGAAEAEYSVLEVSNPQRIATNPRPPITIPPETRRFQTLKGSLQTVKFYNFSLSQMFVSNPQRIATNVIFLVLVATNRRVSNPQRIATNQVSRETFFIQSLVSNPQRIATN